MKCLDQLAARAAQVGATLDEVNADYTINLDSPPGYVWCANGCTCLCETAATNQQTWFAQACREISERAAMGLEKVTDEAQLAEIRHTLGDDEWGAKPDAPARLEWPQK